MLYLEHFNYIIKHMSGTKNVLADTLSRRPDLVPEEEDNKEVTAIPSDKFINFITDDIRSEEHTSELQSRSDLVCRLLLEKKNMIRLVGILLSPQLSAPFSSAADFNALAGQFVSSMFV